jgi:hypothetical protein
MREYHGLAGRLAITVRDTVGHVVEERRADNLITSAGRGLLGRLLTGGIQLDASQVAIAIGTGNAAPSVGDTALAARIGATRASAEAPVAHEAQMKVTVTATFAGAGLTEIQAVSEAGIELTVTGQGTVLYNRVTFPPINRTPNLDMTLSWEVLF